jgi:hypothetical protein
VKNTRDPGNLQQNTYIFYLHDWKPPNTLEIRLHQKRYRDKDHNILLANIKIRFKFIEAYVTTTVTAPYLKNSQKEGKGGDDELRLIFKNVSQFIVTIPMEAEVSIAEE